MTQACEARRAAAQRVLSPSSPLLTERTFAWPYVKVRSGLLFQTMISAIRRYRV